MTQTLRQLAPVGVLCLSILAVAVPVFPLTVADRHIMDLKSPDPLVRAKAAYELGCGCSKPSVAVPPLIKLMQDPVAKVRQNAATALGAYHAAAKDVVPAMLDRLGDEDVAVRRAAIISLGMLGKGSEDAEKAVSTYLDDPDPATRMDAVVAAAAMGKRDDSLIPQLVEALGAKDEATAKATRKALTDMGNEGPAKIVPSLVATLEQKGDPRAVNAVRVLGNLRNNAAQTAPQIARAYDKVEPAQRHFVVDALLAVDTSGEQAIPILNKSMEAIDSLDRKEALLGLMRYRTKVPAIMPTLVRAFHDASQENRLLAVAIVRGLGEPAKAALPALIPLTDAPDERLRKAAVGAIGSIRPSSPDVIPVLEHALQDKDVGVRLLSVYALRRVAEVSPEAGKNAIKNILQDAEKREAESRMKGAIRAALPYCDPGSGSEKHSKLDEPDKPQRAGEELGTPQKAQQ